MRLDDLKDQLGDKIRIEWKSFMLRPSEQGRKSRQEFLEYSKLWAPMRDLDPRLAVTSPWGSENPHPSHSLPALAGSKLIKTFGEDIEDDFHHFRVEVIHDASTILEANGTGLRGPWVTCMESDRPLRAIEGHPLTASSTGIGAYTPPTKNCTHLFDLTGLTVAHSQRDEVERVYDFAVTDTRDDEGTRELAAWRNGEEILRWTATFAEVLDPPEWRDAPLATKFIPWAAEHLDPETAEVAIALRRVIAISHGRVVDLDATPTAADLGDGPNGRCHSFQPEVAVNAIRVKKSAYDFAEHSKHLLADMAVRDERPGN